MAEQVVLVSEPPYRLSSQWHAVTESFGRAIEADPDELTVVHGGFEEGSRIREGVSGGWPQIVSSLKSLLETGEPLPA